MLAECRARGWIDDAEVLGGRMGPREGIALCNGNSDSVGVPQGYIWIMKKWKLL